MLCDISRPYAQNRRYFPSRFRICDKVGKELKIAVKKLKKTLAKWVRQCYNTSNLA